MKMRTSGIVGLVGLVLLSACPGDGDFDSDDVTGIPVEQFLAEEPPAWCEHFYTCTPNNFDDYNGNMDACIEGERERRLAILEDHAYQPLNGALCVEELRARIEDCSIQAAGPCLSWFEI